MKTCVIFNPAARGEKAAQFRAQLASLSGQCALKPTYAAGTGRPLAAEAIREGFDNIVAAGGDGTLNEVINGFGDELNGFMRTRLGILPLGTINVFAKELGIPMNFASAWAVVQAGKEKLLNLPKAEFNANGQAQRRYFAQLAGAGLDSRAIELVDWEYKKVIGPLAYVVAGLKALHEPKPQLIASAANEGAAGELVLIGNGRFYGGRFNLFPKANLQDGLLDVSVFPKVNWEILFRSGWSWLLDQLHTAADVRTFRAESFSVSSTALVPFQLDGENVGHLPAKFSVERQMLRVLAP